MRYSALTDRLQGLGGAKWEIHAAARQMKRAGREVIELTIGEPDVPCPPDLIRAAEALAVTPEELVAAKDLLLA